MSNPMMSIFPNVKLYATGSKSFAEIMDDIRNGKVAAEVEDIRKRLAASDKIAADELKKSLPAFTPSGVFEQSHRAESLRHFSGILHLDIDRLTEARLSHIEQQLRKDNQVLAFFRSPSGMGLKVFFKTEADPARHSHNMLRLVSLFRKKYQVEPDKSCKDISRLCYFSYDPKAYYNPNAEALTFDAPEAAFNDIEKDLKEERGLTFTPGSRNDFIFHFALKCMARKLPKLEATSFAIKHYIQDDFLAQEIEAAFKSAYSGKYLANTKKLERTTKFEEIAHKLSELGYVFRRNTVTLQLEYCKDGAWLDVTDSVLNDLLMLLHKEGVNASDKSLGTVLYSSFSSDYDPFEAYLLELEPWDGHDHIEDLWATLGADTEWGFLLGTWLLTLVASMLYPGKYQNPYVLTLIGAQGVNKTRWLLNLLPEKLKKYIAQGILDLQSKDTQIAAAENLLFVIDELDALNKSDQARLKELLSNAGYRVRAPYAKQAEFRRRRASFCASLNNPQFLTDPSGSRRFMCIKIPGAIDFPHQVNMDGVWAQAFALLRAGYHPYLTPEQESRMNEYNQEFQAHSIEDDLLFDYVRKPEDGEADVSMSATEIYSYIAGQIPNLRFDQRNVRNMGIQLAQRGFKKKKVRGSFKYKVVLLK